MGPNAIGRPIDRLAEIDEKVRTSEGRRDEANGGESHRLLDGISDTDWEPFAKALLSGSETDNPHKIALLAELLARHGKGEFEPTLRMDAEVHKADGCLVGLWADNLLSSREASRRQLANIARAIERLAVPSLVPTLRRLLEEDLARRKRAREEFLAARIAGRRTDSDVHMSWTLQYRHAFIAIGGGEVEKLMPGYLPDAGYCGFGIDAAWALKGIWDREQNAPKDKALIGRSDFTDVNAAKKPRAANRHRLQRRSFLWSMI